MATTIRVKEEVRDRLAHVATTRFGGVGLGEALDRLLVEVEEAEILTAYETLRADSAAWAEYTAELTEWDVTTHDVDQ